MSNEIKMLLEDGYPDEEYYVALLNDTKVSLMIKGLNPEVKDIFLYSAKEMQDVSENAIITPSLVLLNVEFLKKNKEKDVVSMVSDLLNKPQDNRVVPLENSELLTMLKDKGFEMPAFHIETGLKNQKEETSSGFTFFMSSQEVKFIKDLQEKSLPEFLNAYMKIDEAHNHDGRNKFLKQFASKLADDIKDFNFTAYALVCNSLNNDSLNKAFNKPGKILSTNIVERFAQVLNAHDSCGSYKRHLLITYISDFDKLNVISSTQMNKAKTQKRM